MSIKNSDTNKIKEYFDAIFKVGFFKRLFGWRTIVSMSKDAYDEILAELDDIGNADELKIKIAKLEESNTNNKEKISELLIENKILNNKISDLNSERNKNEKDIVSLNKDLDQKRNEYDKYAAQLTKTSEDLQSERQKIIDEKLEEQKQYFTKMKQTWSNHEKDVENLIRKICKNNIIEYVDKSSFPTKDKPDNTIKILDEFIVFDAKSPASDDLSNFPTYISNQTKTISKYLQDKNVKHDMFLIVPNNTLDAIKDYFYDMGEYRVYVIPKEAIEPIIKSFKKIEEYDTIKDFSPEDREKIYQVIGRFSHATKRRAQIDGYFFEEFSKIWDKVEDLPEDVVKKVDDFEISGNLLNPTTERKGKKINIKAIGKDNNKKLLSVGIQKIDKDKVEAIELYSKDN